MTTESDAPDTVLGQQCHECWEVNALHWVSRQDKGKEASDGRVEVGHVIALGLSLGPTVDCQMPNNNEVGEAGEDKHAPLLSGSRVSESGREAGHEHEDVGNDGHQEVCSVETAEHAKCKQEKWCCQDPVDKVGPEDLTGDGLVARDIAGKVLVLVVNRGVLESRALSSRHCEVGDGGDEHRECNEDMVQAFGLTSLELVEKP